MMDTVNIGALLEYSWLQGVFQCSNVPMLLGK